MVVLDARNVYESRIGRIDAPRVHTLAPPLRNFTALPAWLDEHEEELRGKRILMYW